VDRVLVDATTLPTNRGGVGRYLDALLGALAGPAGSGAQVVVASKPADRVGYESLGLEVVTGPRVLDSRPVRLGWEQTGLLRRHVASGPTSCTARTTPSRSSQDCPRS
jgi:hypothetical protein